MEILLRKFRESLDELFREAEDFLFGSFEKYKVGSYSSLPSWNLDEEEDLETGNPEVETRDEKKTEENSGKNPEDENERNQEESQKIQEVQDEPDEIFWGYVRRYRSPPIPYAGIEIRKVPAATLGYGVLGRAFPYLGVIEIRGDLYGDEFEEVRTHEFIHMQNPHLSETDVRALTMQRLPFTPRWH